MSNGGQAKIMAETILRISDNFAKSAEVYLTANDLDTAEKHQDLSEKYATKASGIEKKYLSA